MQKLRERKRVSKGVRACMSEKREKVGCKNNETNFIFSPFSVPLRLVGGLDRIQNFKSNHKYFYCE